MKNEEDLQAYFTNRIANNLNSQGRRLMGWNEILNDRLNNDAICHYWTHNFDKVVDHLRKGRYVVMSEMSATYLNYPYKLLPLSTVYQYEPIPQGLEQKYHNYVLGIEAPLWAEYVTDMERLEWQTFPRLIAIAETAWSPKENKNFKYFESKLKYFIKRLDAHEINYASFKEI
jgi:hexosaminidase